jgi:hypothetical protein
MATAMGTNFGELDGRGVLDQSLIERCGMPSSTEVVLSPRPSRRRAARYASTVRFTLSGYRRPWPRVPSARIAPRISAAFFIVWLSMAAERAADPASRHDGARRGLTEGQGMVWVVVGSR